jgi:hypothetical protein
MATRVILTCTDYATIPNDGRRYEIPEEEVAVTPARSPRHQQLSRDLLVLLQAHVGRHGLGEVLVAPTDCILDDTTVVQPYLVFGGPGLSVKLAGCATARAVGLTAPRQS